MAFVWAHADYVKLVRSLHDGRVFDTLPKRRGGIWRRITAMIHWSGDDWRTTADEHTIDTTLGVWYADLPTDGLTAGAQVRFTVYWLEASR